LEKQIDQKTLIKLIDRLNSYPVGLPDTPDIREFLQILMTSDEASVAASFPMREATAAELSKKSGFDLETTEKLLDQLADKGAVIDFEVTKSDRYYLLTPSIIGFIEFSLMKIHEGLPMKRMAEILKRYEDEDLYKEVFGSKTPITRTLVAHNVPVSSQIMTYTQVAEVIKAAGGGALQTCFCRHQSHLIDTPCEVAPFEETCISLGSASSFVVRRGFARPATVEELLKKTRELGEKGLIHVTDNVRNKPSFICNCCGCCCGLLAGINRKNIPHAVSPSPYILKTDDETCIGCAACVQKCQINAITIHNKKAVVDAKNCLGCGSCLRFCRPGALKLVKRKKAPKIPKNSMRKFAKISFEKGRLRKWFPDIVRSRLRKIM